MSPLPLQEFIGRRPGAWPEQPPMGKVCPAACRTGWGHRPAARPPRGERVAALHRLVILDALPARLCLGFPTVHGDPGDALPQGCHESAMWKRARVGQSRPTEYFLAASHGLTSGRMSSSAWKRPSSPASKRLFLWVSEDGKERPGFTVPFTVFTVNCVLTMITAKWTLFVTQL